jgi:hypothetical protein
VPALCYFWFQHLFDEEIVWLIGGLLP